ncbi:MAG: hypothetical protein HC765_14315 [Brachymonas sp.]|nr:hypothetical protein [Brachymonas sp.]
MKYHGKGDWKRAMDSAKEKMKDFGLNLDFIDWTPAKNDKDSFKDEHRRMQSDESSPGKGDGHKSSNNLNKRASPGRKMK